MKAPIAVPVPLKASRTSPPSAGSGRPAAKRASGVGTGEKGLVSCFIWAMTSFMADGSPPETAGTTFNFSWSADEVALAKFDAVVAQDVVRRRHMKKEIRPGAAEQ